MRILLVEDDVEWVELMAPKIEALGSVELVVAETRDAAFDLISESIYDLVICDLKIPVDSLALDPAVDHGVAVLDRIEEFAAGTRVVVLSGFGTLAVLQPYLARGAPADYFGNESRGTCVITSLRATLTAFSTTSRDSSRKTQLCGRLRSTGQLPLD